MYEDFVGNEITLGCTVVFMQRSYRNLLKGVVVSFTPKMINIEHDRTNIGNTTTRQYPEQVVVVIITEK